MHSIINQWQELTGPMACLLPFKETDISARAVLFPYDHAGLNNVRFAHIFVRTNRKNNESMHANGNTSSSM